MRIMIPLFNQHSVQSFACLLQGCAEKMDLALGRRVDALISRAGHGGEIFLGNLLIRMYAACGSLAEAHQVFRRLPASSVSSWATIISAHGKQGMAGEAIMLYHQMLGAGTHPNDYVFVAALQACASTAALAEGRLIHAHVIVSGFESNTFVSNSLIGMYAKCGSLEDARGVFDRLPTRSMVSWKVMIAGYVQNGMGLDALQLCQQMQKEGLKLDKAMFISVLKACTSVRDIDQGRMHHAHIRASGLEKDLFVASALVDMYAKSGSLEDAHKVFEGLGIKDLVTWTSIISAYAQHGDARVALQLYLQMLKEGLLPNHITLVSVLKACSRTAALEQGKLLHAYAKQTNSEADVFISSTLIDMYVKCGCLEDARKQFDRLSAKNRVTWTSMIAGYAHNGDAQVALQLFQAMQLEGLQPDRATLHSILRVCSNRAAFDVGKLMHVYIKTSSEESDVTLGNSLVNMYAKCGSLEDARSVFDKLKSKDLVSWSAMIAGYAQVEDGNAALELFEEMQKAGMHPNKVTLVSILKACSSIAAVDQGKLVHGQITRSNLESDADVCNTLIDMYVKCGNLDDALCVFQRLPNRELVSWNSILVGLAKHGYGQRAVDLFQQMQAEGIQPDTITVVSILKACSSITTLDQGKLLHDYILDRGLESILMVGNTLIDMYANCGSLVDARKVFDRMPIRNLVSWNAMIGGYAQHGGGREALNLFSEMQCHGLRPNRITFVSLLSACSHAGLVDEGMQLYQSMTPDYGVSAELEHLTCVVDLLGRAGQLEAAEHLISDMPSSGNTVMWMSLLGACRTYGNVEMGIRSFEAILSLDPTNAAAYVLLADMYAATGRWDERAKIRNMMQRADAKKEPGCTRMAVDGRVHTFLVEDSHHPERKQMYATLRTLFTDLRKECGYEPVCMVAG